MNIYTLSAGNPEGTDFTLLLQHNNAFSDMDFTDMVEKAIIYALKKEKQIFGMYHISLINSNYVFDYLEKLGFSKVEIKSSYHFEPYWSSVNSKILEKIIKNAKKH